jgi:uncharacterized protein YjbI with pentapeptide repeats
VTRRFAVAAFAVAGFLAASRASAACPPECAGQTVTASNFSHQDLTNANFTGATIIGAKFLRANLTGAKFDNAKFQSIAGAPTSTPDFSFANLTNASFTGAQFLAPTYLTYATLTCADFSKTDISNGNAIFGDDPLVSDANATCADGMKSRTKFKNTVMNCEFIDDWRAFDLTGAIVTACLTQLKGRNFSGAILSGVDLTGAVLDGSLFVKADLTRATLDNASLQCLVPGNPGSQCVDMSAALLQDAQLNNANLSGATLYQAFLSNNTNDTVSDAAVVQQANLKNVNLAFAQLSGVDFSLSNFYGNNPANPGGCATTGGNDLSGFTKGCATAHKAAMTGTKFINSYLYGVDFSDAKITGANFYQAILVGANFADAKIQTFTGDGSHTSFFRAYLQGTNLDRANTLTGANLSNAFLDFRVGGNDVAINLSGGGHNQFAACAGPPTVCKVPSGQDVCVYVRYPLATVPSTNTTITCPKGPPPAGTDVCGTDISPDTSLWKSNLTIGAPPKDSGIQPGWYNSPATFEPKAPDSAVCGGKGTSARVFFW